MDKTTGYATIVILIILAILILVVAIVVSFYHVTRRTDTTSEAAKRGGNVRARIGSAIQANRTGKRPQPRLPIFDDDSTAGASGGQFQYTGNARSIIKCGEPGTNSVTVNGVCRCEPPYWGLHCELESYSHDFVAVGSLQSDDQSCRYINQSQQVGSLADCQEQCGEDCAGFYYKNHSCTLLSETPTFHYQDLPTYQPLQQSELYLKRGTHPLVTDRVFLYEGHRPLRYWIGTRDNVLMMEPGQLYRLPFLPDGWINDGKYRLAYSDQQFKSPQQAKFIQYPNKEFAPQLYEWVMVVPHNTRC